MNNNDEFIYFHIYRFINNIIYPTLENNYWNKYPYKIF